MRMQRALEQLYTWLDQHLTEALIVQVKLDGSLKDGKTEVDFANAVLELIN
jgi:hypothetical protein